MLKELSDSKKKISKKKNSKIYLLFFSTSILTFNNFLAPLTGAVNESSNILLFGFPFYTASLAYLAMNSGTPNLLSAFKIANPLLLATGPIALFIKNYSYRKLHFRVNYYFPFFIKANSCISLQRGHTGEMSADLHQVASVVNRQSYFTKACASLWSGFAKKE